MLPARNTDRRRSTAAADACTEALERRTLFATTTGTVVESPDDTTVYGEMVALAATVSGAGGTPTGDVNFYDGATLIGTDDLDGAGVAVISTTGLSVGAHTLTAVYVGDLTFDPSTSPGYTQTVSKSGSLAMVDADVNTLAFSGTVTVTASVVPQAPGDGVPTGNVTFYDGATPLGTVALSAGEAAIALSTLGVGGHTITASYAGDGNFTGSITGVGEPITITNNAPTAVPPTDVDVDEDAPESVIDLTAIFEDVEDGDNLIYSVVGTTNTAIFSFVTLDGNTLTLTYAADAFGTSDVTIRATDANGAHADAVFNVNVGSAPDPGRLGFSAGSYAVTEGGTVQLVVQRVGGSDGTAAVAYSVAGGTAFSALDTDFTQGVLTFADGETSKTIAVAAKTDDAEEGAETMLVELSEPTGGAGLGAIAVATITITDVYNHAPVTSSFTVTHAPGEPVVLNPLGHSSDADGGPLALVVVVPPARGMATIDDAGTPADPSDDRVLYTPAAGTYGDDAFTYVVTDAGGKSASGMVTVRTAGVALAPNPTNAKLQDLVVIGTAGNDDIRIYAGKKKGELKVTIDDASMGNFKPTGRVVAFGGDGNDTIQLKYVKLGAVFYGGAGDDRLEGSRGSDVLVGGDGDDRLFGWEKRDLIIGGDGADESTEKKADDLLIGDATAYDADSAANRLALFELLSAWNGKGSAAARAAKLANGVGPMTAHFGDDNVDADGIADVLVAQTKKNWVLDLDAADAA